MSLRSLLKPRPARALVVPLWTYFAQAMAMGIFTNIAFPAGGPSYDCEMAGQSFNLVIDSH